MQPLAVELLRDILREAEFLQFQALISRAVFG